MKDARYDPSRGVLEVSVDRVPLPLAGSLTPEDGPQRLALACFTRPAFVCGLSGLTYIARDLLHVPVSRAPDPAALRSGLTASGALCDRSSRRLPRTGPHLDGPRFAFQRCSYLELGWVRRPLTPCANSFDSMEMALDQLSIFQTLFGFTRFMAGTTFSTRGERLTALKECVPLRRSSTADVSEHIRFGTDSGIARRFPPRRGDAARRRRPHASPAVADSLGAKFGAQVFLKPEMLQRGGAFKFRGAYWFVSQLSTTQRAHGLVAPSSGNHGQAVALAAKLFGARSTVVMPTNGDAREA